MFICRSANICAGFRCNRTINMFLVSYGISPIRFVCAKQFIVVHSTKIADDATITKEKWKRKHTEMCGTRLRLHFSAYHKWLYYTVTTWSSKTWYGNTVVQRCPHISLFFCVRVSCVCVCVCWPLAVGIESLTFVYNFSFFCFYFSGLFRWMTPSPQHEMCATERHCLFGRNDNCRTSHYYGVSRWSAPLLVSTLWLLFASSLHLPNFRIDSSSV